MQPTSITYNERSFVVQSRLSFELLFECWKEKMADPNNSLNEFYADLLDRISQFPELLHPIEDLSVLSKYKQAIDMMMATIFPVTLSDKNDLYAISIPFTYKTIYYSSLFKTVFLKNQDNTIVIPNDESDEKISEERIVMSYQMILNKFYGLALEGKTTSIHPYMQPDTGQMKYLELELDPKFVDVKHSGPLPDWNNDIKCTRLNDVLNIPDLSERLPLSLFQFEGFVIIKIKDVTEREVISEIKNHLLKVHSFADSHGFEILQEQMQKLIGLRDIRIGIAPFLKINNHYVFSEGLTQNSFILKHLSSAEEKTKLCLKCIELFENHDDYVVISSVNDATLAQYPFLKNMSREGIKSLILLPLKSGNELIGVLSVVADTPGTLKYSHTLKIEPAIPLFVLALEKSAEELNNLIDKIIKEQFTAVQSSVEWKFTEAALKYVTQKNKGRETKIETIVFDQVFPLYAAIDIRNSSVERSHAIQQDLIEQLNMAGSIIKKAQLQINFPLLDEINYRIEKYIYNVSNILFSGDEIAIHTFLQEEIVQMFEHLQIVIPGIQKEIEHYFSTIDANIQMLYRNRKHFEESITIINNELAKFLDDEQKTAQKIFPHYFERFVTDGIDFNIYIGQSITPQNPFDYFYLRNLKLWQITTLAKAAQMTKLLEKDVSLPLSTTQLILAHSNPISISFRTAERKFDVDGAYNIRYEIIKKRIDKVRIKDTNERLTQPGTIAIVFSQVKEATEYTEYIEFLQKQGMLSGEIEKFELEELQGISGLKALRVSISELSDINSQPSAVRNQKS